MIYLNTAFEFRLIGVHEVAHRWGADVLPGKGISGPHWFEVSSLPGALRAVNDGIRDGPFDEIVELGEDRYSVEFPMELPTTISLALSNYTWRDSSLRRRFLSFGLLLMLMG